MVIIWSKLRIRITSYLALKLSEVLYRRNFTGSQQIKEKKRIWIRPISVDWAEQLIPKFEVCFKDTCYFVQAMLKKLNRKSVLF